MEEKKKFNQADYYQSRKEELSKTRKKKYKEDKAHRELIKKNSRAYKESVRAPKGMAYKLWKGQKVLAYKASVVSATLGITPRRLVVWEEKGWIPMQLWTTAHRHYTPHQLNLLKKAKPILMGSNLAAKHTRRKTLGVSWEANI